MDLTKFMMLTAECFIPTLLFFGLCAASIRSAFSRTFSTTQAFIGLVLASLTSTLVYVGIFALGGNAGVGLIVGPFLASLISAFAVSTPRIPN